MFDVPDPLRTNLVQARQWTLRAMKKSIVQGLIIHLISKIATIVSPQSMSSIHQGEDLDFNDTTR